jgi:hypothetical protein
MLRLMILRLWDEDDVGIFASSMLQPCCSCCDLMFLFAEDDSRRDMLQVLILEDPEEAHDGW